MQSLSNTIIRELTELSTGLREFLPPTKKSPQPPGWREHLDQYARKTLVIRLLAGKGDHVGLHDACMLQHDYLRSLLTHDGAPTAQDWERLENWPLLMLACLHTPVSAAAVDELIAYFRTDSRAFAFNARDAEALHANLLTPRTAQSAPETNVVALPVEPKHAGTEPTAPPETTVRYLLQHELRDTITEYLSVAGRSAITAAEHAQALRLCADRIQLLGISAAGSDLLGLMDCCLMCHGALIKCLETHNQLNPAGREQLKIWAGLIGCYLDRPGSTYVVDALLDFYQRGHFIPRMHKREYDTLRDFLLLDPTAPGKTRIEVKAVPVSDIIHAEEKAAQETALESQVVTMPYLLDGSKQNNMDRSEAVPDTEAPPVPLDPTMKPPETMLRVSARVVNDLLRLCSESIVMTNQLQERLRQSLRHSKNSKEQNALLQQFVKNLRQSPGDDAELNELMRVIMEAQENSRQLEEQLAAFGELLPALARNNKESYEAVLYARRVPVSSIVPRLQRSVQQTYRGSSKPVKLTVTGAETMLDSDILDNLSDPLIHLLRTTVDHGIETTESRRASGKPETSVIELHFALDGDQLAVRCCDDGAGLDYARIQQLAAQNGLIDSGRKYKEAELNHLIFLPGFSNGTEGTPSSERIISLRAVRARVLRMKGAMAIVSQARQGCSVEIRVPLGFISIHALLVTSSSRVLAISCRCIEQIFHAGAGQTQAGQERLQYRVGETTYDAYALEQLLHLQMDHAGPDECPALLVRDYSGRLCAVFVEQVLASQDLIVKQLGPYLPNILGIEGATILGNGDVAAVIDLRGLLQTLQPEKTKPVEMPV